MNRKLNQHLSLLIGITAAALVSNSTLADELASEDLNSRQTIPASDTTSVQTKRTYRVDLPRTDTSQQVQDAVQGIMSDNKLELDLRLSGIKSDLLAAGL